jgi:Fic family protein
MDKKAFVNPNGKFAQNSSKHITFMPKRLPPQITYSTGLITLLSEANLQLGQLSGIGELLPNPELLIRPYIRREAVLSSKIEGTQASMIDIFEFEAAGGKTDQKETTQEKRVQEVVNYVTALNDCLKKVNNGGTIDLAMIKNAHKSLMTGVRGQEKTPGKFRIVQNWIGPEGSKIEDAIYVPPPPDCLEDLLLDVEKFIRSPPPGISPLVQCAFVHYQFEAIHPFADGNGRIGRLLIPLLLAERRVLSRPMLYLSAYFEANRSEYYRHLLSISQKSTWEEWLAFFLKGVIQQSSDAIKNIRRLMELRTKYEEKLKQKKAPSKAIILTENLFANPIVTVNMAKNYLDLTYPSAKGAIDYLQEMGILVEMGHRERDKRFYAREILKILT